MGWSRAFGTEPVDLVTTGLKPEITCTWNLVVKPEIEFDKTRASEYDALAIPGGFEKAGFYEDAYDERCLNLIQEKSIVVDKNIITSTGPSTGLEVAFKLLGMLTNAENVGIVKKYMRFN